MKLRCLTAQTLQGMSTERDFDLFWAKIETARKQFDVKEPILPRRRKIPKRLDDYKAIAELPDSVIDWYRLQYNAVLELAVSSIKSRFDHKGYQTFSHIEQLLFMASTGLPFEEHLNFVCDFFDDDFNKAEIAAELRVLKELYFNAFGQEKPRLTLIKDVLAQLSSSQNH